jgi:hypothetical protein
VRPELTASLALVLGSAPDLTSPLQDDESDGLTYNPGPWQDLVIWTCPVNPHLMNISCNIIIIIIRDTAAVNYYAALPSAGDFAESTSTQPRCQDPSSVCPKSC